MRQVTLSLATACICIGLMTSAFADEGTTDFCVECRVFYYPNCTDTALRPDLIFTSSPSGTLSGNQEIYQIFVDSGTEVEVYATNYDRSKYQIRAFNFRVGATVDCEVPDDPPGETLDVGKVFADTEVFLVLEEIPTPPIHDPLLPFDYPDANAFAGDTVAWGHRAQAMDGRALDGWVDAPGARAYRGEFVERDVDLQLAGRGLDFVWTRTYRSQQPEGGESGLGPDWDHSYNLWLEEDGGTVTVGMGNARAIEFEETSLGSNTYEAPGWPCRLNDDGGYRLHWASGITWTFGANNRVSSISDRNGNTLTLAYSGNQLTSITDTLENVAAVSYDGDRIDGVSIVGREVEYTWCGAADPDGPEGALKEVRYTNDDGTGLSQPLAYTYTKSADEDLDGNLLTITDARGNAVLANTYGTDDQDEDHFDRLVKTRWGAAAGDTYEYWYESGEDLAGITGAAARTIVQDRKGHVTEYFYYEDNRLIVRREYEGVPANLEAPTTDSLNRPATTYFETSFTWRPEGDHLDTITYPKGNTRTLRYETDNNPGKALTGAGGLLPPGLGNLFEVESAGTGLSVSEQWTYGDYAGFYWSESFPETHTDPVGNVTNFGYDANLNLEALNRPALPDYGAGNAHVEVEYNEYGQPIEVLHPRNGTGYRQRDVLEYGEFGGGKGKFARITRDANGEALITQFFYDNRQMLDSVLDPGGFRHEFDYTSTDWLAQSTTPEASSGGDQYRTRYEYDENGNVEDEYLDHRAGGAWSQSRQQRYTYTALNLLDTMAEDFGGTDTLTHDYDYDASRNLKKKSFAGDTSGNDWEWEYDERDLLTKITRSSMVETTFAYDDNGNLEQRLESANDATHQRLTAWTYDAIDRVKTMTDPEAAIYRWTRDEDGLPNKLTIEGPDGFNVPSSVPLYECEYVYDEDRRLLQHEERQFESTAPGTTLGYRVHQYEYTDRDQLKRTVDPRGYATEMTYDTLGRLAAAVDPLGNVRRHTYDARSLLTRIDETDAGQNGAPDEFFETLTAYDGIGRVRSTTDNDGNIWSYTYDERSRPESISGPELYFESRTYTGLDLLESVTYDVADGTTITTTNGYDSLGRLTSRTDDNGNVTVYDYDELDRLKLIDYPGESRFRIEERDPYGNALVGFHESDTGTLEVRHDFLYDDRNRLVVRERGNGTESEAYSYDGLNRLVEAENDDSVVKRFYDSLGNLTRETQDIAGASVTRQVDYAHDATGNVTGITTPSGVAFGIERNPLNQTSAVNHLAGPSDIKSLARYLNVGRRAKGIGFAHGGTVGYEHDALRRVNRTLHELEGVGVVDDRSYAWDGRWNMTRRTETTPGAPGNRQRFYYDRLSRMDRYESEASDGGLKALDFALDGAQNRDSVAADYGIAPQTLDYTQDDGPPAGQPLAYATTPFDARTYDLRGNLETADYGSVDTYDWDAWSRLTSVSRPAPALFSDDFADEVIPSRYTQVEGTWSASGEALSRTGTGIARIAHPLPAPLGEMRFTIRPLTVAADYKPKLYAMVVLPLDPEGAEALEGEGELEEGLVPASGRYLSIGLAPDEIVYRDWDDGLVVSETPFAVTSTDDYTFGIVVAGGGIEARHAIEGNALPVAASHTLVSPAAPEVESFLLGIGQGADVEIDDVIVTESGAPGLDDGAVNVTLKYDALGRCVYRGDGTTERYYYYDGWRLCEDWADTGGGEQLETGYVYGRGIDEVLVSYDASPPTDWTFYHADALGNIVATTEWDANPANDGVIASRIAYGPYGQPHLLEPDFALRNDLPPPHAPAFTGRHYDAATGLYDYRTRHYEPRHGRFLSRDTLGLWGDPANHGNPYAYVGNNPWSRVDPFGEQTVEELDAILDRGSVRGAAVSLHDVQSGQNQLANEVGEGAGVISATVGGLLGRADFVVNEASVAQQYGNVAGQTARDELAGAVGGAGAGIAAHQIAKRVPDSWWQRAWAWITGSGKRSSGAAEAVSDPAYGSRIGGNGQLEWDFDQTAESSSIASGSSGRSYWTKSVRIDEIVVHQRNDLIDPSRIDSVKGTSNLQRMKAGLAPLGPDGRPIQLHHLTQEHGDAMAELTATMHQRHSQTLHIDTSVRSKINRAVADRFRARYWIKRAEDFDGK